MESLEEQYKRETGEMAFIDFASYPFHEWLKSKYEAEHTLSMQWESRCKAAEEYINALWESEHNGDYKTLHDKADEWQKSVQSMEAGK